MHCGQSCANAAVPTNSCTSSVNSTTACSAACKLVATRFQSRTVLNNVVSSPQLSSASSSQSCSTRPSMSYERPCLAQTFAKTAAFSTQRTSTPRREHSRSSSSSFYTRTTARYSLKGERVSLRLCSKFCLVKFDRTVEAS